MPARVERAQPAVGVRYVADYEGKEYTCQVVKGEKDGTVLYKIVKPKAFGGEGGTTTFRSLSGAGGAIAVGKSINGWTFWRIEGTEAPEAKPAGRKAAAPAPAKPAKASTPKAKATVAAVAEPDETDETEEDEAEEVEL